jgi:CPA1 family monovalent cation:H+ antiporter
MVPSPYRGALLVVCYGVVVFTILVQGLSMPLLVQRLYRPKTALR